MRSLSITLSLLGWLFILALPVLLLTSNIRWVTSEERFYRYEFDRQGVQARTGLPEEDLMRVTRSLLDYFNSNSPTVDVRIGEEGQPVPSFFSLRERSHLADVQGLLQGTFRAQEGSLAFVLFYLAMAFLRQRSLRTLARQAALGAILTALLVTGVGAVAIVNFDWAFLQFHFLSFANDLWRLDPRTDRLVQMFPQGFWYDASLLVGLLTILEATLVATAAGLYLLLARQRVTSKVETTGRAIPPRGSPGPGGVGKARKA
ncbi:MAG TPA: TIGR01906 family membrane protein [Dehalococcoidia bacterium]|nr:TIGR01906 family membrane protein [Dehalococcoidia bacterium]